jgi:hypothetical protein
MFWPQSEARTFSSLAVTQSPITPSCLCRTGFFIQVTVLGFSYLCATWRSQIFYRVLRSEHVLVRSEHVLLRSEHVLVKSEHVLVRR